MTKQEFIEQLEKDFKPLKNGLETQKKAYDKAEKGTSALEMLRVRNDYVISETESILNHYNTKIKPLIKRSSTVGNYQEKDNTVDIYQRSEISKGLFLKGLSKEQLIIPDAYGNGSSICLKEYIVIEKAYLEKLLGKSQNCTDSCGSATKRIAVELLTDKKDLEDEEFDIVENKLKEKLRSEYRLDYKEKINTNFNNLVKQINQGNIVNVSINRRHTTKKAAVLKNNSGTAIITDDPIYSEDEKCIKSYYQSFYFEDNETAEEFLKYYLNTEEPVKNKVKKGEMRPKRERSINLISDSIIELFIDLNKNNDFKTEIYELVPSITPDHTLLLIGVRKKGKQEFALLYDQNYTRKFTTQNSRKKHIPMVYEIPLGLIEIEGVVVKEYS